MKYKAFFRRLDKALGITSEEELSMEDVVIRAERLASQVKQLQAAVLGFEELLDQKESEIQELKCNTSSTSSTPTTGTTSSSPTTKP